MLVIHGKKVQRIPVGWAVDTCPICRDLRAFSVNDVRKVHHVNYVAVGQGTSALLELTCHECGLLVPRPNGKMRIYHDSELAAVRAELEVSPPPALVAYLALQDQVLSGAATRHQRISAMAEPFNHLHYLVTLKQKTGRSQSISAVIQLALICCILATIGTFVAKAPLTAHDPHVRVHGDPSLWVIFRAIEAPKAAARKHALPLIARSLQPMHPTREEVAATLDSLKPLKLAKALSVDELMAAIELDTLATSRKP